MREAVSRPASEGMVDCELIRSSFPAQPVATLTALGFVVAGILVMVRRRGMGPLVFGILLVGVGAASFLLHGFGWSGTIESLAVIALASWTAAWGAFPPSRFMFLAWAFVASATGVLVILDPSTRHAATAIPIAAAALILALYARTSRKLRLAFALLAAAIAVYVLSRTGGPWCVPSSPLQGHGLWHLLSAAALWLVGESLAYRRPPRPDRSSVANRSSSSRRS
jgi:hypothetical protein